MNLKDITEDSAKQLLYESLERKDMPQYEGSLSDLKDYLDDKGILYTKEEVECSNLSPVQKNFSKEKVKNIKPKVEKGNIHDLIVSKSYDILDGHHRWKAGDNSSQTKKLPVFRIHLPTHKAFVILDEAIKFMEQDMNDGRIIVIYPGRFQPFHRGHSKTFEILRDRFGRNHTYITTTDNTDKKNSPFNFNEKKRIITSLFNVPSRFVVKEKNPYTPKNLLKNYKKDKDILIAAVGVKDQKRIERLTKKDDYYYELYNSEKDLKPFGDAGYVYPIKKEDEIQLNGKPISGSTVRELFRSPLPEDRRRDLFEYVFGSFDEDIYGLVNSKLQSDFKKEERLLNDKELEVLSESINFEGLIREIAQTDASVPADDGPASWYADPGDFEETEQNLAKEMGYEVVDYMFSEKHFEGDPKDFKQDALKFVSFFPTGIFDKHVSDPLRIYRNFSEAVAETAGYEVMKHIGIDEPEEEEAVTDEGGSEEETEKMTDTGGIEALEESVNKKIVESKKNTSTSHLRHPFEDYSLTFKEVKTLISNILNGNLNNPREKTDGQNLKVTWKDDELKASRTKTALKNNGQKALDREGLKEKFEGRGDIKNAFLKAFEDISNCFSALPNDSLQDVFQDGRRFLSLEVIYKPTENVIPYDKNILVFQEVNTYSENGDLIDRNSNLAEVLFSSLKELNSVEGDLFKIMGQPEVSIPDISNKELKNDIFNTIANEKNKYDLNDSDPILKNLVFKWNNFVNKKAESLNYNIPEHVKEGLVRRWALDAKSGKNGYSLRNVKSDIEDKKFLSFVLDFDKNKKRKKEKQLRKPFEYIFLRLGSELLSEVDFPLIDDQKTAKEKIKRKILRVVKKIKQLDNESASAKLKNELRRIKMAGGLDLICPAEGIVFNYKGELYKITGLFSPINQLVGILKYNRFS